MSTPGRRWRWLRPHEQAAALALARDDPGRPWSEIARTLGLTRAPVVRYLRAVLGPRRGRPEWRAVTGRPVTAPPARPATTRQPQDHRRCQSCGTPIPAVPPGARYRCPCGRLIAA